MRIICVRGRGISHALQIVRDSPFIGESRTRARFSCKENLARSVGQFYSSSVRVYRSGVRVYRSGVRVPNYNQKVTQLTEMIVDTSGHLHN